MDGIVATIDHRPVKIEMTLWSAEQIQTAIKSADVWLPPDKEVTRAVLSWLSAALTDAGVRS